MGQNIVIIFGVGMHYAFDINSLTLYSCAWFSVVKPPVGDPATDIYIPTYVVQVASHIHNQFNY